MGSPAVVTPEAVPLGLQPAGLGSRFVALLIDWAIQGLLALVLLMLGFGLSTAGDPGGVGIALFFLLVFVIFFGYPIALETLWRGRTVGKAALGLRVVTIEGGPVRLRHAATRAALGVVDFSLTSGAAAVISVLVTRNNQRLGDLVAGTLVLRERTGLAPPQAAAFTVPAGLEAYAASLDVSGITADDYRALRAFLLRAPSLDYRIRYQLAVGLADPLSDRVRPLPPAGTHPDRYLVCLAAVYQQRTAPRPPTPWQPTSPLEAPSPWAQPAPAAPPPPPPPPPPSSAPPAPPSPVPPPIQLRPPIQPPPPIQLRPPVESPPSSPAPPEPVEDDPRDGGFAPLA